MDLTDIAENEAKAAEAELKELHKNSMTFSRNILQVVNYLWQRLTLKMDTCGLSNTFEVICNG